MFRLLKLAFYVAIGYALYELYQGFKAGQYKLEGEGGGRRRGQMTGAGEGMDERSEEPTGMSSPHTVGRGVVS